MNFENVARKKGPRWRGRVSAGNGIDLPYPRPIPRTEDIKIFASKTDFKKGFPKEAFGDSTLLLSSFISIVAKAKSKACANNDKATRPVPK